MNQPRSREEEIFETAVTLPPEQRAAVLKLACGDDGPLRQRVEELLLAHDQAGGFLEGSSPKDSGPAGTIKLSLPPDEKLGEKIGPYKLREKVGEGGCGVVYVAEQEHPVRRRVALKVIKLGMDTKSVIARFEAERQALAMMDHPNIAKVLDAGTTDVGRPYFVMELVRGIRITDYCDQNNLSTKERLDLFIKVCQAIQHAHQKGIIHRDIKPSNILVTLHDGVPVPKVIDFGIAKATEGRLTEATVYTELHQFIGTPVYMSPEQAEMSGLDIDTRSDIYSLGVLLYELLAGSTPFDAKELMASGLDAMRKTIREKEPVRPSTRFATLKGDQLTTTAKRRSADKSKLMHQLKGDLDWIVMKCLEKDRTRRYETANGIAADIKRHLNNEAVVARPPSTAYRLQKAYRRNKLVFAAVAAVAVALLIGTIASTWQAVLATHAKRDAQSARQQAEANEKKAVEAQANESKMREQAQVEELAARQRAYASDMNVAMQVLNGNNLGRALDLLNRQRPRPGQRDLRGWEWRYLWQQTHSDASFTLCQESSEIVSLAVSPDGLSLAVGLAHKGGLSVWDLRTRQEVFRLAKDEENVHAAFSPTEPLLAFASTFFSDSGEQRNTLRLWNTVTRQMISEFPLDSYCMGLVFAKDGRTLVTATDEQITLWRILDGTKVAGYPSEIPGLAPTTSLAVTPDLSLAACASINGRFHVIDLRDGRELWKVEAAKVWVTALGFSPDGRTVASGVGFAESDIRLWDVATGKEIGKLEGHGSWVSSLVFSADGKQLTSSSADQTIRTWDLVSRKCLDVLRGHRQEVWRLAALPDGKTLVSGGKDGTVCFWDTSVTHPSEPCITLPESVITWCFTPDSRSVLTLNRQGQVSRRTGEDFQQKEPLLEIGATVSGRFTPYQFSQDGRLLAAGSTNGVIQIWDLSRRLLLRQWTNGSDIVFPHGFLADGNSLIINSPGDHLFREWNIATGMEFQSWRGPKNFQGAVAVSPDERRFVALGYEGDAILRNLADGSQAKLNLDALEAGYASFSPDGNHFAISSDLGHARVWETATWRQEATIGGFLLGAHSVAFSPDGKRLAIASGGKEAIKLCDTESWQDVLTLEGQGNDFQNMAFSPDGNIVGRLNQDSVLQFWHAPSWAEIIAAEAKEKAEIKQP